MHLYAVLTVSKGVGSWLVDEWVGGPKVEVPNEQEQEVLE